MTLHIPLSQASHLLSLSRSYPNRSSGVSSLFQYQRYFLKHGESLKGFLPVGMPENKKSSYPPAKIGRHHRRAFPSQGHINHVNVVLWVNSCKSVFFFFLAGLRFSSNLGKSSGAASHNMPWKGLANRPVTAFSFAVSRSRWSTVFTLIQLSCDSISIQTILVTICNLPLCSDLLVSHLVSQKNRPVGQ